MALNMEDLDWEYSTLTLLYHGHCFMAPCSFGRSDNTGTIDLKMDKNVLEEK